MTHEIGAVGRGAGGDHGARRSRLASLGGVVVLALVLSLGFSMSSWAADTLVVGDHAFEYRGVVYSDDGTSTWTYRVTSAERPSLSHWVLEFDASLDGRNVLEASEAYEVNTDPRTRLYGIKFDRGYCDGDACESRDVWFTLDAWYEAGNVRVGTKAGQEVEVEGSLTGPKGELVPGAGNADPVAVDDEAHTPEGRAIKISVLGNDSDPDGDVLVVDSVTDPANGRAKKNGKKKVQYTPNKGFTGVDSFQYTIADGNGGSATAVVRITISAVNRPPEASPDEAVVEENGSTLIDILANDSDPDGTIDPSTVDITKAPGRGEAQVDPRSGEVVYTAASGKCGDDYFKYTVKDNSGDTSGEAKVDVTVVCNEPPTANDDVAATDVSVAVTIDVTANDSDPDGTLDKGTVMIDRNPKDGEVSVDLRSGTVTYTPNRGSCGADTFRYTVADDDGVRSNVARVDIAVACNAPPVAEADFASTDENTSVAIDVAANDLDPDGTLDKRTVVITDRPRGGSTSVHPGTGVVTYTPDPGTCGNDAFAYTIDDEDGATSNEATVTVEVLCNDPPLAIDDLYNVTEGETLTIGRPGVLSNDVDTPGSPLVAVQLSSVEHGALSLRSDGSFTYTHDGSETLSDAFTYLANDGSKDSNPATVSIVISPSNDVPTAEDDSARTDEDRPVTIDVLENDDDIDGDVVSVDWVSQPQRGSVVNNGTDVTYVPDPDFAGTDSFTYTASDGHGGTATATVNVQVDPVNDPPFAEDDADATREDVSLSIPVLENDSDRDGDRLTVASVSQPENGWVDNGGNEVTYTPDPDFHGVDTFTYNVSDGAGGTATATVTVAVVSVNDPPIAEDDGASTNEDMAVTLLVLTNDTDPEGDALEIESVSRPEHGGAERAGRSVVYTPNDDFYGVDAFVYTVSDGNGGTATATITVTVNPVNDPPVAQDDSAATDEDTPVFIEVLGNDRDPEGDRIVVESVGRAANGEVTKTETGVSYVPNPQFQGVDAFEYTISDGAGGSATGAVTVSVAGVNDPPEAQDDSAMTDEDSPIAIPVLGNDRDPDGDSLVVESVSEPAHGSVRNDIGSVTYAPEPGFHGVDTFTYAASDGNGGSATATVIVAVATVNDPPVAGDDTASTDEDTAVTVAPLSNDHDPDGDPLAVQSVAQPANGSVTQSGDVLTYTPNPGFHGTDTFSYTASDGQGGTATATIAVTVASVNDDPLAVDDRAATSEGEPVTIGVLSNDSDADGDALAVATATQPLHGATLPSGNAVIYTPASGFEGTDTFTYTVTDGNGGTATGTVTVDVVASNDPPVAQDDNGTTKEDTPLTVRVLANDRDADGDVLVVEAVSQPANGVVTNFEFELAYVPDPGFVGIDAFFYTVSDGNGRTDEARVTVVVQSVNDPPIAQDDNAVTDEGTLVTISVLANDVDSDGDFLLVESFSQPANGSVLNSRTAVSYIPDSGFRGVDRFTYSVTDGNGGTATATVTVSVAAANDPPIARDDSAAMDEGTFVLIPVVGNDADPDGDVLAVESVSLPVNGGALTFGTEIQYTPYAGFSGVDEFTYTISDGKGGKDTATVHVAVVPVNDPPAAQNDSATTDMDDPVTIAVLQNDTDPDGDTLTVAVAGQPQNGTVASDGFEFTYTPDSGFTGTDRFTYTVSDGRGRSDTATVTVGVAEGAGAGGAARDDEPCDGRVIISEVAWAGTAADSRDEWIELRNLGGEPVDLTGWVLRWRRTHPETPDDRIWNTVDLSGMLAGAPISACDVVGQDPPPEVRVFREDSGSPAWNVAAESVAVGGSYYTLERRSDDTVSGVSANLIYDDASRALSLELSDLGEVIMLVDDLGDVVDTANASNLGRDGWVGGSDVTRGTMERIDPLGADTAENWQTNMGVVIHGADAKGQPVRGTPAGPNSPVLDDLDARVGIAPSRIRAGETLEVGFTLTRQDRRMSGWPWISVTRPGFAGLAGAGGAIDPTRYVVFGRHETADRYVLEIGTANLTPGSYVFWVIHGQGEALLVPLTITP